jgi:hypothetical protein
LLDQPDYHLAQAGKLALHFDLPRYGVSLVRLTW